MPDSEKFTAAVLARTANGQTLYAREATIEVTDETSTDTSPATLSIDLAQLHLRTTASPLPKQPAAMGWQMTAASLSALASRLLDVVQRTAPEEAAQIAEWFSGPFGDGPDLEEHHDWVTDNISGSWDLTEEWIQEARRLAVEAQQATAAQMKES
jgi:hypothetical protein